MLNIGKLAPGAADYYIGEIATSAEDYYTGRGESAGRWVGSLARDMGLVGAVEPGAFRAVLEGRNPITGEQLASGRSGACRARLLPHSSQPSLFDADSLDVPQVAARLRVTTRRVRQLLTAGARASDDGHAVSPGATLVGQRERVPGQRGPLAWSIPKSEVERFESERRTVKTRPGYDLTLRPPKSVSVLWAVADDGRRAAIRDAHREAVNAVVDYYERHACYARRPTGDRGRIDTDGLIAAAFDHRTSRAGDPLLHTHVVCANLTRTAEGRWQAIDGRPIYDHAHAAGYLYQAHLRHVLTRTLGIEFGRVRNGYAEAEGVPRAVIKAFSKRRDEIEEVIAESGYTSARAHQAATLATRKAKEYGTDALTLEESWRQEAMDLGFGEAEIAACFGHANVAEPPEASALFSHLAGPAGLTAQASTFTRQDVVEAIAEAAGAGLDAAEIDRLASRFIASDQVRALAAAPGEPGCGLWRRDGSRERSPDLARFTMPELLTLEEQVLAWASEGFGSGAPTATSDAIDGALGARPELSAEQVAMVHAVCGGTTGVQAIAGRPGSGKTHATAACVNAYLRSGVPVVGCALSAVAAAELEAATGLLESTGRPASTIARLLIQAEDHGLAPGTVLIVDEASMVGTRDLARLGALVARAGGAMKLIGDPDQHGPVETGGLFRHLINAAGDRAPRLVENNRQEDGVDRQAVEEFRQEFVELALSRYDAAGKVVRSSTAAESYNAMADDWFAHVQAGGTDPMIAGTNHVRRALNERARSRMVASGALVGAALSLGDIDFQTGDWIVARRNATVLRSPDRLHFVKNGSSGRVVAVDAGRRTLTVDFDVEGTIDLPAWYLEPGNVEYGYARTSYGVQGATLERALYHPGDSSSFEEGYVALTRGRRDTRIYIVDGRTDVEDETAHGPHERHEVGLETMAEALERRRSKTLAIEADPLAAASAREFRGWSLAELRAERSRLEAVLDAAPAPVDAALSSARRERDALLARKHAWESASHVPRSRGRTLRRRESSAAERMAGIEKGLENVERHVERLEARCSQREGYLAQHASDVERLRLLYRAELAREVQVRADAAISDHEPTDQVTHQLWRDAAERAAVHGERFPTGVDNAAAARSYERAVESFRAFAERTPREASDAAETLEV
jgi:conjugative relaxase-like TrwC/TraI family protein